MSTGEYYLNKTVASVRYLPLISIGTGAGVGAGAGGCCRGWLLLLLWESRLILAITACALIASSSRDFNLKT